MAPLRIALAGGIGGAIGATGIVLALGRLAIPGPVGWTLTIAGVLGAIYGSVRAKIDSADTASQALQVGLFAGLDMGSQVLQIARTVRPAQSVHNQHSWFTASTQSAQLELFPARAGTIQCTGWAGPSDPTAWTEELRNDDGEQVAWDAAACDLDLTEGEPHRDRFRMASGLAATCDDCGKILYIGLDWFHEKESQKDLCGKHQSELPPYLFNKFQHVHSEEVLGAHAGAYALKVRVPVEAFVFSDAGPRAEGKVVLEVSHLINPNSGKETLASLLQPLMPNTRIEEYLGTRSFSRIIIDLKDEAAAREIIKSLGRQRNKRVGIKELRRFFDSPRF